MDESPQNTQRRPDFKQIGLGGAIGAAIIALTPLNSYIADRQQPLVVRIETLKEITDMKLDNIQRSLDRIEQTTREQATASLDLINRVTNLEFLAGVKRK